MTDQPLTAPKKSWREPSISGVPALITPSLRSIVQRLPLNYLRANCSVMKRARSPARLRKKKDGLNLLMAAQYFLMKLATLLQISKQNSSASYKRKNFNV